MSLSLTVKNVKMYPVYTYLASAVSMVKLTVLWEHRSDDIECYASDGAECWTYCWRRVLDVLLAPSAGRTVGAECWTYCWRRVLDVLLAPSAGRTVGA